MPGAPHSRVALAILILSVLLLIPCAARDTDDRARLCCVERAPAPAAVAGTLLAAGDIAFCDASGDEATARLLDAHAGTVITLGDNAYPGGSISEFLRCYDPTWGRARGRTFPSPGNHEYVTGGAAGYFEYFGEAAGDATKGYYSFDVEDWHLIALNSNCDEIGGCGPGSPQERWLRADLAASRARCVLAYWHHPRFSSGDHGSHASMQPFWQALYGFGADVVLSGHDHSYERFAPQSPDGASDPQRGIVQFVVGTGGKSHYGFGAPIANSDVRHTGTFGVLKLTLRPSGYDWEFLSVAGGTFADSGSADCVAP